MKMTIKEKKVLSRMELKKIMGGNGCLVLGKDCNSSIHCCSLKCGFGPGAETSTTGKVCTAQDSSNVG